MATVPFPSDEEAAALFGDYTSAVGKVAYAWNSLHENLGSLFVVVAGAAFQERETALSVWYSTENDRAQRKMLSAAAQSAALTRWKAVLPKAGKEIAWLLRKADAASDFRNDAIHMPASLYIGGGKEASNIMGPAFFNGHPRAERLIGKDLMSRFAQCERAAESLSRYSSVLETAIAFAEHYPWPDRPVITLKTISL